MKDGSDILCGCSVLGVIDMTLAYTLQSEAFSRLLFGRPPICLEFLSHVIVYNLKVLFIVALLSYLHSKHTL